MQFQVTLLALSATLIAAAPHDLSTRGFVSDTANDWGSIISGKTPCAPVAAIFARGTFDSGYVTSFIFISIY